MAIAKCGIKRRHIRPALFPVINVSVKGIRFTLLPVSYRSTTSFSPIFRTLTMEYLRFSTSPEPSSVTPDPNTMSEVGGFETGVDE